MFDDDLKYPEPDPNKRPAAQVWDDRYGKPGFLYGKEPVVLLKNFVSNLHKGKALDVAMGEGRNAAFLAANGFQVEGLDCSAKGVEKSKLLATEKGVSFEPKTQNLDFFLMPLMKYDTVVMTYYKPAGRFFSEIKRGLVAGGTVLIEAHLVDHQKHNPNNPLIDFDQLYRPNELVGLLKDFQILYYNEFPDGMSHTVQAIARKVNR